MDYACSRAYAYFMAFPAREWHRKRERMHINGSISINIFSQNNSSVPRFIYFNLYYLKLYADIFVFESFLHIKIFMASFRVHLIGDRRSANLASSTSFRNKSESGQTKGGSGWADGLWKYFLMTARRERKRGGDGIGVGPGRQCGNDGRYADVLMTRTESHRQTAG